MDNRKLVATSHERKFSYWLDSDDRMIYQRNDLLSNWVGWLCSLAVWESTYSKANWITTVASPEWTKYTRVDEIIECFDVNSDTTAELLRLMPNAYGGEAPGEDDGPEPDHPRDAPYKLSVIWEKLSEAAQADILKAYATE